VARLPSEISDEVEEDPTGGKMIGASAHLNGAPNKLEALVQFHVGETVLALTRTELQPGGQEVRGNQSSVRSVLSVQQYHIQYCTTVLPYRILCTYVYWRQSSP
jgi:hypothetical protein